MTRSTSVPHGNSPDQGVRLATTAEEIRQAQVEYLTACSQSPREDLRTLSRNLTAPTETDRTVICRLNEYAQHLHIDAARVLARYNRAPLQYSLDVVPAIARSVEQVFANLAGIQGIQARPGKTFGHTYAHGGVVALGDVRASGPQKRISFVVLDRELINAANATEFDNCLKAFLTLVRLSNHDPLHSVIDDTSHFAGLDSHLRYGGIEFAPIVVHSCFVRERLSDASLRKEIHDSISAMIQAAGRAHTSTEARCYWVSLALRHLLLVLPTNDPLVQHVLSESQRSLFPSETRNISRAAWDRFLHRDFSSGDHSDTIPRHHNNGRDYEHGKHSMLRSWLRDYIDAFVPIQKESAEVPMSQFVLFDTLRRGHGIYSIATVADGESSIINQCREIFRAPFI